MHFGVRLPIGASAAVGLGAGVAIFGVLLVEEPNVALLELHTLLVEPAVHPDRRLAVVLGNGGSGNEVLAV